jgi:hypothetical protein
MLKGRALSLAIEAAIATGRMPPQLEAAIERAYGAFHLEMVPDTHIARVAHLTRRAHEAIRGARGGMETAYVDCAKVLYLGLPSAIRRRLRVDDVVEVVRALRREADGWLAVVDGTMVLLGWSHAVRTRAAQAIRVALDEHPPASEEGR